MEPQSQRAPGDSWPRVVHVLRLREKAGAARLSPDTLERISYVLGIFKALRILLPRAEARAAWLRNPNSDPEFGGASPIAVMTEGKVANLYRVRRYLDGQRGW